MKITVNHQDYDLAEPCSVSQMLQAVLKTEGRGIAIAINQTIVLRPAWSRHLLKQGDQIMLIKATQGG